jgi:opacity protein-like surface antigen
MLRSGQALCQRLPEVVMKAGVVRVALVVLACGMAQTAHAQSQAIGFSAGYFGVKGEDGRIEGDVLIENRNFLIFETKDFNGGYVGGEYLFGIGDYIDAGASIGYYRRTVPTIYDDFVDADGTEIDQDLKLRIVPIALTARILPLGRSGGVQPYVGAGLGIFNWRYSETGEFLDFTDFTVFRDRFVATGTDYGAVALAGVRVPAGPNLAVGGEFRYQQAEGETGGANRGFLGEKIDLGGYTLLFNVHAIF